MRAIARRVVGSHFRKKKMQIHTFKAMKKPILLSFRFAEFDEEIQTLEGLVTARAGDAVLTGTKGENWPITREKFEVSYDFDKTQGTCAKKPVVVSVQEMSESFQVTVGWSNQPIRGSAGDFKVTYGPDDFGVVAREIFLDTYSVVEN